MEFANKEYLFLLVLIIPYLVWYLMYRKKQIFLIGKFHSSIH